MAIKSNTVHKDEFDEQPKTKMEEFKESQENDLVEALENFISINNASKIEDLGTIQLYRLKAPKQIKDSELLDEWGLDNLLTHHEIGKKYGGGSFLLSMKLFNPDSPKNRPTSWLKDYFTLGTTYNKHVENQTLADHLNLNNTLAKLRQAEPKDMPNNVESIISMQGELIKTLMLKTTETPKSPLGSLDIAGIITAIAAIIPLFKSDNSSTKLLEAIALKSLEGNNDSEKVLGLLERGMNLGQAMNNNNDNDNLWGTIVPMIPDIVGQLAPVLSSLGKSKSLVEAKMKKHYSTLEMIRQDKEKQALFEKEMIKQYGEEKTSIIAERIGIDRVISPEPKRNKVIIK